MREITLDPFAIDETAVTVDRFRAYVEATAKRGPIRSASAWSFVFRRLPSRGPSLAFTWTAPSRGSLVAAGVRRASLEGARRGRDRTWKKAGGPSGWSISSTRTRWPRGLGGRAPSDGGRSGEYAARGGARAEALPWGDEPTPRRRSTAANIWQGTLPPRGHWGAEDGFMPAPPRSRPTRPTATASSTWWGSLGVGAPTVPPARPRPSGGAAPQSRPAPRAGRGAR